MTENEIAKILVNIFLKVHRTLGPGLFAGSFRQELSIIYNSWRPLSRMCGKK